MEKAAQAFTSNTDQACLVSKEFEADDKQLHAALGFLEEELEKRGAGRKETMSLALALEEAFVNVAHYAYEGFKEPGKVRIALDFKDDIVDVILEDSGIEFDPLKNTDPDVTARAEDRRIGGLGIFMIKKSTDGLFYERKNGRNILTMRKKYR